MMSEAITDKQIKAITEEIIDLILNSEEIMQRISDVIAEQIKEIEK